MTAPVPQAAAAAPLAGRGIVVTRPVEQAGELARLLREAGAEPILFPALEIRDPDDPAALRALLDRLDEFDLAIFISPTAADRALALLRPRSGMPARLALAAVGQGTARALERLGAGPVIAPRAGADSEALLALPDLQAVAGRRIVIFRGAGGRELLAETLTARGAVVEYAECYRRARPAADPSALLAAWAQGAVHAVTATSAEALRNLLELLGNAGRERLRATPLFVPHPRIAAVARELGLGAVFVTGPGDAALVQSLVAHFGGVP